MPKNRKTRIIEVPKPTGGPFKIFFQGAPELIARNLEAFLLTLAFLHILLFLVFLGAIAVSKGDTGPRHPFGEVTATAPQKPEPPQPAAPLTTSRVISRPSTIAFTAFTIFLWSVLVIKRRSISLRVTRFLILMLFPGTIMAIYAIIQALRP